MIEKRAFNRVPFATKAILTDNDTTLLGRLDNISFGGAMVRLEQYPLPSQDSKYSLTVYVDEGVPPLQLIAEVACVSALTVGLRFTSIDENNRERLGALMCDIERRKYTRSTNRG